MAESQGHFSFDGLMKGHGGWVTSIAATQDGSDMILTGSRDRSIIQWQLNRDLTTGEAGFAQKRMDGHSNFVQDVQISSDSQYGLSASWDGSLRLWDLKQGNSVCRFVGHSKDAMSCAFSPDNRQIISGSRDHSMRLWNTLGEEKFNFSNQGHQDWVSCTRFSPNPANALVVSCSWDKTVKVWSTGSTQLQATLEKHTGYLNSVTMSPDGSLCASGGKDGTAMLWDLHRGEHLYSLESAEEIHDLCFSPNRYWLCAAVGYAIKIWDLESKQIVAELVPELPQMGRRALAPECISLAWSQDGSKLFSGYTDNTIRVWGVSS